jgi:hypothetical protein
VGGKHMSTSGGHVRSPEPLALRPWTYLARRRLACGHGWLDAALSLTWTWRVGPASESLNLSDFSSLSLITAASRINTSAGRLDVAGYQPRHHARAGMHYGAAAVFLTLEPSASRITHGTLRKFFSTAGDAIRVQCGATCTA